VVFSVDKPLEDLLEPELLADYYEFLAGHHVYLPLLDEPGITFRINYIEKVTGKTLDSNLRNKILSLTGGHMKLVRMSIEACFTQDPPQELELFLLKQKTIIRALLEIWHNLTPSEQRHLELVTQDKSDDCESKAFLEQMGLLHNNEIQIPLFTTFILQQDKQQTPEDNLIRYDTNTNEILKGKQNISDMLTAAEYRLLRFLLEHQEQIVDREQIINAVWLDAKSTAGVTYQALDQLILRIRKKIEEDVKNPHHLLTIKGRGFKFAP
jgi:DNA-binding winged helix-turn-helix (wHTH) protein